VVQRAVRVRAQLRVRWQRHLPPQPLLTTTALMVLYKLLGFPEALLQKGMLDEQIRQQLARPVAIHLHPLLGIGQLSAPANGLARRQLAHQRRALPLYLLDGTAKPSVPYLVGSVICASFENVVTLRLTDVTPTQKCDGSLNLHFPQITLSIFVQ